MEGKIMRVVQQGEAFAVQSQKSESGQVKKCHILLPWNILLVLNSDFYFFTFLFSKLALGPILLMTD